jgi:DNA-binding response OmpR family regulator
VKNTLNAYFAAYNVTTHRTASGIMPLETTLSRRVLFVDDEPSIRATLPVILKRRGYVVDVAATVAEALEALRIHRFDILICDLNIGRAEDGYTVIEAIRQVDPRCIVIVLTGCPELDSALKGIHYRIDEYIIKPTGAGALVTMLEEKLAARRPKARILSVSYDLPLLRTRHMLLERDGYEVISTSDLETSLEKCKQSSFDIFILGHSIPGEEKQKIVKAFRETCQAPIISLRRGIGDSPGDGADFHIDPDPEPLLNTIADVMRKKKSASSAGE